MKRILLFASALAGLFAAASCQQENLEPEVKGGVTYEITLPAAPQTKGETGYDTYDLHYEVYRVNGTTLDKLFHETVLMEENTIELPLDLLNDQTYTVIFWAQEHPEQGTPWIDASDLQNIKLKESLSNNDHRDAFCAVDANFSHDGAEARKVTLTRPFAQVNIATTVNKVGYDITPKQSLVTFRNIPTGYNLLSGETKDPTEVTFGLNGIPGNTITVNGTPYTNVAMNYVLVAGANINEIEYKITTLNGTVTNKVPNVPVKQNYRTNIIGNLLTSNATYTIELKPGFETPDEVVEVVTVSTASELVDAIAEASTVEGESTNIKLEGDINLSDLFASLVKSTSEEPKSITIPVGKEFTLDLNGYSLTGVDEGTKSFGLIHNQGNLTITNSSSKQSRIALVAKQNRGWNAYSSVISNNPGGNLLVKGNVLIEHLGGTDMAYGIDNLTNGKGTSAVATVDGATVKSVYRAIRQFLNGVEATNELYVKAGSKIYGPDNKSIWMQDPSKNANTGKLVVEAGAELYGDVYLTVTAGSTEWPVEVSIADAALQGECTVLTSNVPEKYELVNSNGVWTVEATLVEEGDVITVYSANALKKIADKVNAGENYFEGKTIKLGADIDLKNVEWTPIGSAAKDHGFMGNFEGNGKTIKNLKMTTLPLDADGYVYAGLFGVTEGTDANNQNYIKNLVIENVEIATEGHIAAAAIAYPYYTIVENVTVKGDINIKGGNYTSGVLAYTRRCVDAKDLTIAGNADSVIEGNTTVGGVISDIQMNGGLTANYSNFKASGLTIKAVHNVGGISGIISNQTLDGATVENVHIDCDHVTKGIVSGALGDKNSVLTNVSYTNVTGATSVIGGTYGTGLAVVTTADELVAALEANHGVFFMNDIKIDPANMSNAYGKTGINVKNGQTIDGNGYTLNIKGAGGTWDSGINTTGGLIKNLTVTGSFRGIFINHNSDHSEKVVLENVTITGTTYTISCDQGKYQGIEATNCTFNGWTSFAKTAGEAKFVKCTFGEGNGYKYCRPYSKTEFVECTFCTGYTVDTTQAEVTFTNCINQ